MPRGAEPLIPLWPSWIQYVVPTSATNTARPEVRVTGVSSSEPRVSPVYTPTLAGAQHAACAISERLSVAVNAYQAVPSNGETPCGMGSSGSTEVAIDRTVSLNGSEPTDVASAK